MLKKKEEEEEGKKTSMKAAWMDRLSLADRRGREKGKRGEREGERRASRTFNFILSSSRPP